MRHRGEKLHLHSVGFVGPLLRGVRLVRPCLQLDCLSAQLVGEHAQLLLPVFSRLARGFLGGDFLGVLERA